MTEKNELRGLGGWLILVGIGVVTSPFRLLASLIPTYKRIFESGAWHALTTEGSEHYVPYFGSFLVGEIIFNAILITASFYLIVLFFSKHYLFPRLYIGIVGASLVFILLDAWLGSEIFPGEPMFDPETTTEFSRAFVAGMIWIPYMLVSKRVKATFVRNMPNRHMQQPPKSSADLGDLRNAACSTPVIRYVNMLLYQMHESRTPIQVLHRAQSLPTLSLHDQILEPPPLELVLNRLKIMCGLNPVHYSTDIVGSCNLTIQQQEFSVNVTLNDESEAACKIEFQKPLS